MTTTRILIFAKAPTPGRVKTRLIPALGAAGAARLARRMLEFTLEQARMADIGPVELCASPALTVPHGRPKELASPSGYRRVGASSGNERSESGGRSISAPDWAGYMPPRGVAASDQGEGDLGARMARASQRALALNDRVLLIGTDCPGLSALRLREAAAALDCHEAVIHPALDGGYPLLGLRTFHPSLFTDMPWSTPTVADLTLARMQALEWCVWVGDELADIDEPADLIHLPAHLVPDAPTHLQGEESR